MILAALASVDLISRVICSRNTLQAPSVYAEGKCSVEGKSIHRVPEVKQVDVTL